MKLSRQFLSQLNSSADPALIDFFTNNRREITDFSKYEDVIDYAMTEYVKEDTMDVRPTLAYHFKTRKTKRARWANAIFKKIGDSDLSHKSNPFYFIAAQADMLTPSQFEKLYHTSSINDVMQTFMEQIKAWSTDSNSYLINFPLLFEVRRKDITSSFVNDVLVDCLNILVKNYDGNPSRFMQQRPEIMIDIPMFAPFTFRAPLAMSENGQLNAEVDAISGKLYMVVEGKEVFPTETIRMFDSRDAAILSSLISFARSSALSGGSNDFVISAVDLFRSISNDTEKKIGGKYYSILADRLHKMAEISLRYVDTGSSAYFSRTTLHLLDQVQEVDLNGKKLFRISLGADLYNSIVQQKVISMTRNNYEKLCGSTLAQLLYPAIQRERINLTKQNAVVSSTDMRLTNRYNQNFFSRLVLFDPNKHRSAIKNMKLIAEALAEFQSKQIAIESIVPIDKLTLQLYFFPLTAAERVDFGIDNPAQTLIDQTPD